MPVAPVRHRADQVNTRGTGPAGPKHAEDIAG